MPDARITYTPNLALTRLPANYHVWAQIMNDNLTMLDAAVSGFIVYDNWRGAWTNSTHYAVGDTVVDLTTAVIWTTQVDHTSSSIPTTFNQEQVLHPTYWIPANAPATKRGAWTGPGTVYNVNDFVLADGTKYAMCLVQHVSDVEFSLDLARGLWTVLFDVSVPPTSGSTIYPASFGAMGDGITDDTAALQAAINYANARGGGTVDCSGGRWLIDSADLLIKDSVFLVGSYLNLGQAQTINNVSTWYTTADSIFIVNPLRTLRLINGNCGISKMGIIRKGIAKAADIRHSIDQINGFSGTAITIGDGISGLQGNDSWLGNLFIGGFNKAISTTGQSNGRTHIEWIQGDCTNGIDISNSLDMQHLSHVHFWPFLNSSISPASYAVSNVADNGSGLFRITIAANALVTGDRVTITATGLTALANSAWIVTVIDPVTIDLQGSTYGAGWVSGGLVWLNTNYRSGVGINFSDNVDWGQMDNCFTFGYANGIRISNSGQSTLVNCGCDFSSTTGDPTSVGILVTGPSRSTSLIGCKTAAQGTGLQIDAAPYLGSFNDSVLVTGHRSWGNKNYGYRVSDGYAFFMNCAVQNGSNGNAVYIDDNAAGITFSGCDLQATTFVYQSNNSVRPSFYNCRGAPAPLNPVVNFTSGVTPVARFEAHTTTPTANDTITKGYYLTDDAGAQQRIIQENYRAQTVTAGAMTSNMFWTMKNAGVDTNVLAMQPTGIYPLVSTFTLGITGGGWSALFMGQLGNISWGGGTTNLTGSQATQIISPTGTSAVSNIIGYTVSIAPALQISSTNTSADPTISLQRYSTSTNGPIVNMSKSQTSTEGAQGIVGSAENLGIVNWNGSDGVSFKEAAWIKCTTDGTTGAGAIPARVTIGTSPSGAVAPVEHFRVSANGDVTTNALTAVGAGAATQHFIKASSTANLGIYFGTGVPAFAAAKGSIFTSTNATTTTTRLYVNTDGSTTWTNLTTAA